MSHPDPDRDRDHYPEPYRQGSTKRATDSFVVVAGIVLAVTGLVVVGFFVVLSVALSSWANSK